MPEWEEGFGEISTIRRATARHARQKDDGQAARIRHHGIGEHRLNGFFAKGAGYYGCLVTRRHKLITQSFGDVRRFPGNQNPAIVGTCR